MKSLNEQQGTTISELEATLAVCRRLLRAKLNEGAKGIVFAKGKPNQVKMTYKKAYEVLKELEAYFGYKGCVSFGICKTCTKFDTTKFQDKRFGYCGNTMKHMYDTCEKHSKSGGGFGL